MTGFAAPFEDSRSNLVFLKASGGGSWSPFPSCARHDGRLLGEDVGTK